MAKTKLVRLFDLVTFSKNLSINPILMVATEDGRLSPVIGFDPGILVRSNGVVLDYLELNIALEDALDTKIDDTEASEDDNEEADRTPQSRP